MKFEKIILNNLTSIEGEQIIDFTQEPLRSAGLFAITGNTGAGKSTILDAICLTLYNKAPRFDNIENIPKEDLDMAAEKAQQMQASSRVNILRRGQKSGGCTVIFTTTDGDRYEASWSVRVTRNGNYSTPERTLRQLAPHKENVDKAFISHRIEAAIGLNYAQFTRTVILAQNSFANFLKAPRAEKASLLEKLTGTEIYGEISKQIYAQTQQAEAQVRELEKLMEGTMHDHLSAEELTEEQERKRLLSTRQAALKSDISRLQQQMQWFADYDDARKKLAEKEAEHTQAHRICMGSHAEAQKLERYDSVLSMQPLFQEIILRRNDIAAIKLQETENNAQIDAARNRITELGKQLDVARERSSDAVKLLNERRPAIDRGHVLTGEMKMANEQLARTNEQLALAQQTLDSRQSNLQAKQERIKQITADIQKFKVRKQALSVHSTMFDKFDLVKDKLAALRNESAHNADVRKKLETLQKKLADSKTLGEKAEKEQQNLQDELNKLKNNLQIHRSFNQGSDSAQLQKRSAEAQSRLSSLRHAAVLWQHISEGYAAISEKRATQKREEVELNQKRLCAGKQEVELKATESSFELLQTTYTLSQSKDIVNLRKQLKEGTACPVCGATHHPYHTETERELGELLTSLQKDYTHMQQELEHKRNALAALREEIAADAARLEADKLALAELEKRQQADVEEWKTCAHLDSTFSDCSATVNRDARRKMIELLIENTIRASQDAEKNLETYNLHQENINKLNEEIATIDAKMNDNRTFLDNIKAESHIAAAAAEDQQNDLLKSDNTLKELYADLDEMVTLSGWFSDWRSNPDGFRTRLSALHIDWGKTCTSLDNAERSEALLQEEINGAEANVKEEMRHVAQCRANRDAIREGLSGKREELRRLFGDKDPQKEAEDLQQSIVQAQSVEQQSRTAYETEDGRMKQLEGMRQNLLQARLDNQREQQEKHRQLDLLMNRFNGTHSPIQFSELESIFSDKCSWKELRERLNKQNEQRVLALNRLEQAQQVLMQLRAATTRPESDDEATRTRISEEIETKNTELADIDKRLMLTESRLFAHANCEKRAAELNKHLEAAQSDFKEWSRLNVMLGSSDGKKFRTVAQSHTFRYLVEHANHHLRQLSSRYELHTLPGTLTLEIIDRDMFDEHRYVHSLSGGETFVVSLALALGLASLSGNNLTIGSLFIDEGFGNLDHESLDLVMTALSNLENSQGRKVGVISHTDQIRMQITPQIRLIKLPGSGSSRIEIR